MKLTSKVELTAGEWMSLIDKNGDGLPRCCGNISALRDEVISLAREGGEVAWGYIGLLRTYRHCLDGHEMRGLSPALDKLIDQILTLAGLTHEQVAQMEHEKDRFLECPVLDQSDWAALRALLRKLEQTHA